MFLHGTSEHQVCQVVAFVCGNIYTKPFNDSIRLSLKGITSTNWNLNCRKIAEV